jgi:hypothetical protein
MNKYFEQAKLMLSILPIVGQEKEFALTWTSQNQKVYNNCLAIV